MKKSAIFVFGSNTHGIHGAGAAHTAKIHHGAQMGKGYGHYGHSFAIPTKSCIWIKGTLPGEGDTWTVGPTLAMSQIRRYVNGFLEYAEAHEELTFQVTRIGCGLAGRMDADMAHMFYNAPTNCQFDSAWAPYLFGHTFWGTF